MARVERALLGCLLASCGLISIWLLSARLIAS